MKILFYSPFDQRSRDVESLILAFKHQGHEVISLSQGTGAKIHEYLEANGVETATHVLKKRSKLVYYFLHILFLIRFSRRKKIDIIYSHLESSNFVAVIAQYFLAAKVFICRHHVDEAALQGFDNSLMYKLTYRLAKKIIVVSNRAVRYMADVEKISIDKIIKINLAYDFDLYAKPDEENVAKIRILAKADLILITIGRFTKHKRIDLSIRVLRKLLDAGIDATLIVLGRGEEERNLQLLAAELGVLNKMVMPGHVPNVTDYLASSDFLIHPSILESSCVVVKEAAITNLPVIVCNDVGDFDDYIVNNKNGFLAGRDTFEPDCQRIIETYHKDKKFLDTMTDDLKLCVKDLFSIHNIISQYDDLNSKHGV